MSHAITSHPVERLIATGPMPLAQLARRARNAKTGTAVLQNAAHYLGEAGAALAASYWLGRALADDGQPSEAARHQLSSILGRGASFGTWVGLWRECAAQVGGEALSALSRPVDDIAPIEALIGALDDAGEALGEDGRRLAKLLKQARKRGVLGFFEFLAAFRNKVYGHGTMLSESACQKLAPPFLSAVVHMLGQSCVFQGAWLGRTAIDLLSEGQQRYWLRLSGVAESSVAEQAGVPPAADVAPGALYFVAADRPGDSRHAPIPLGFCVVQDEDATGLSRFGFLQRALARRRRADASGPTFKGVEYLDYLGGRFRYDGQLGDLEARSGRWFAEQAPVDGDAQDAPRSADERRFGDFLIEAELGRGAMGIVYRATQVSLDRKVALKVLPPAMLSDSVALGRFHREVQALGRCDHPNVVRVLASGVEDGRPWFAMELVEGADLSEVFGTLASWKGILPLRAGHLSAVSSSLSERRLRSDKHKKPAERARDSAGDGAGDGATLAGHVRDFDAPLSPPHVPTAAELADEGGLYRRLAELFAEAADGVQDIHNRGVMHRDLKPANLMLSKGGERLVVMDLGLAKMSDTSVSYTRQSGGDFVGSARYAAPEQLQAKLLTVDHRADIYSLGATLYELVTLHALYPAQEIAELLQHKLSEDPAPARSKDRKIPRDLETILQKSLARRPEDRYRTAGELAADLRAFAEHRPIRARPPSAFEYLRLFYHRQPRLVHLGLVAVVVICAVVASSFVLVAGERSLAVSERDNATRERDNATRERDRAESLASYIFDDLYQQLEPLGKLELLEDVTARMADYYRSRDLEDPAVARRYAQAMLRTGEVEHRARRVDSAAKHYQEAKRLLNDIRAKGQSDDQALAILADTYYDMAGVDFNQNRLQAALQSAQHALKLREALAVKSPESRDYQHALARSHRQIGVAMERLGKRREALGSYRQAVDIARAVIVQDGANLGAREEVATNLMNTGEILQALGHHPDALKHYREALALLHQLTVDTPLNMRARRHLASCHDNIARTLLRTRERATALEHFQQAMDLRTGLVQLDRSRAGWQRDLASSYGNIAQLRVLDGALQEAHGLYESSLKILQALAAEDPAWQMDVAVAQAKLGEVLDKQDRSPDALERYRVSLATASRVVASDPENTEYQHRLGDFHGLVADVLKRQGQLQPALASIGAKRAILTELVAHDPDNMSWRGDLLAALRVTAELHVTARQYQPAMAELTEALALQSKFDQQVPVAPDSMAARERSQVTAALHHALADAQARSGDKGAAKRSLQTALSLYVELGADGADGARVVKADIGRLSRPARVATPNAITSGDAPAMTTAPIWSRSRKNDTYE